MKTKTVYDLIIVGAGIGGIVMLHHAKKKGLRAIVLEKQSGPGGIWRKLPKWQDIQMRKEDWTINNIPIHGVKQEAIVENISAWIEKYHLHQDIRFNQAVCSAKFVDNHWIVSTKEHRYKAKFVVAASGAHNEPFVPNIERKESTIFESHSSSFHDPTTLKDKRVTVVGAGASALDLLDLALEYGAAEIRWIYRSTKWFLPTSQPKHAKTALRHIARAQMLGKKASDMNQLLNPLLKERYKHFGLEELIPDHDFDYEKEQVVPGRYRMIANFQKIIRHKTTIQCLEGATVQTEQGAFETDIVLWATGYRIDLSYLGLEKLANVKSTGALSLRCGGLVLSLDYPNLFLFGIAALDSNGTTPFTHAVMAKSVVSHIKGDIQFTRKPVKKKVVHWGYLRLVAEFDKKNYGLFWKIKFLLKAIWYYKFQKKSIYFD